MKDSAIEDTTAQRRSYLSIREVLDLLLSDFPDVTISKIRFLESRGLIHPERTPSGSRSIRNRKFMSTRRRATAVWMPDSNVASVRPWR